MEKDKLITISEVCNHYNIEVAFVDSLKECELIEITTIKNSSFIHHEQLRQLEKFARLHYDLGINLEGLEVINHLLQRVETMQYEMTALKNRLDRFQDD